MKRLYLCASAAVLCLVAVPAFAGSVSVPEPGILTLVAGAIAAAVIVGRIRKK